LRRVLPDRFRVSTGFIYRWNEQPTRQIDILIWDAQEHSALLEEGELAILTADAVSAMIEVKSTLDASELKDALELLSPRWLINWRYTTDSSRSGLPQETLGVPFRAVFAYNHSCANVNDIVKLTFSQLASFYQQQLGPDAERALGHCYSLEWTNLVNAICIADSVQIEQAHIKAECEDGRSYSPPCMVAYDGNTSEGCIAVGRFCMYLLNSLTGWSGGEAVTATLRSPSPVTTPGVCSFCQLPAAIKRLRIWGTDVAPETFWRPAPPLWIMSSGVDQE
jgi:hypothetical protein